MHKFCCYVKFTLHLFRQTGFRGVAPGGGTGFAGGRMTTAMRGGRAGPSSMGRPITGAAAGQDAQARPMTAVRAAGYTAAGKRGVFPQEVLTCRGSLNY